MSPMNHVGRRLLPPIFIPNISHNQSASRIVALTFLTKNMNNESLFFVQRAHPYRAFLRNHIRMNFTVPTAPTAPTSSTASTASGVNSTGSHNQTTVNFNTLLVLITKE